MAADPGSVAFATYISAEPEEIDQVFGARSPPSETYADAVDTWRVYELFAGAFQTAEHLGEDLSARMVSILSSGHSRRRVLSELRALDARRLHSEAARVRSDLIESAKAAIEADENREIGFYTLGLLGVCLDGSSVPDWRTDTCSDDVAPLAPYLATCLDASDLTELLESVAGCGDRMHPFWITVIESFVVRRPRAAREMLSPLFKDAAPFIKAHVDRLLNTSRDALEESE